MELTKQEICKVAKIAEQFGAEVIETYLLGDRDKGERLWIWDKECLRWVDCWEYPWEVEDVEWSEFYVGSNPNE